MPPAATPRRHRRGLLAFTAVLAVLLFAGSFLIYAGPPEIPVGPFSNPRGRGGLPPGWKPWILNNVKRHTTYRVVQDGSPAFRARADASASGLMRAVNIDPREYPVIAWRWKVAAVIEGADISRKEKNDSPARLYVAFAYDINKVSLPERLKYWAARHIYSQSLPLRAIAYTWANRHPVGSFVPMPYTSWFMQVTLENDASPVNEWITEERDVHEDYRKAFGEEPQDVTGVAIMTNTDNMGGKAETWYGNIVFKQRSR